MSLNLSVWKYLIIIPHLLIYKRLSPDKQKLINDDVMEMNTRCGLNKNLAFYLAFKKPYRNLFYYRVGRISRFLRVILPPYPEFFISDRLESVGGAFLFLTTPMAQL